ncbi:MAG TPA: GNAT family N-acetyltransferase [Gemmatimonadaceae bacterium]
MRDHSITVRRALPKDADAIADVHVASWRSTYRGIVDQAYIDGLSVSDRAAAWTRRLTSAEASAPDILVATTLEDDVVGFISGGLIRDPFQEFDAELHAIYLLKTFQRLGLGQRLVREWATVAIARHLRAAVVRVLADNPACAFYEKLGAVPLADRELVIGGKPYPERWYGWRSLVDLST